MYRAVPRKLGMKEREDDIWRRVYWVLVLGVVVPNPVVGMLARWVEVVVGVWTVASVVWYGHERIWCTRGKGLRRRKSVDLISFMEEGKPSLI